MTESNMVRISCQSSDWEKFCLVSRDSFKGIGGRIGVALDRCKGLGCKGDKCPTQFMVDRKTADTLKKENPDLVIVE